MFEELRFILILLSMIAGFTITVLAMRKDRMYIGNRLLALAYLMVGIYGISMIIHETVADAAIVVFSDRLNYSMMLWSVSLLFLTMEVMVNGVAWLKEKRHIVPVLLFDVIFATLLFCWQDAVKFESFGPPVNTKNDPLISVIFGIGVLFFLIYSIYAIYVHGVKKTDGKRKRKMAIVCMGFIMVVGAALANFVSNLNIGPELGAVFDILYFGLLATGICVTAAGFQLSSE